MTKSSILILHFRELSKYPPVLNLISYFNAKKVDNVCLGGTSTSGNKLINMIWYLGYILKSFAKITVTRNCSIIYYESISATPVYLYYRIFPQSKKKLYIHFHEYFDAEEHLKQSYLERLGRRLEVKLFDRAVWISHTNKHRLDLFYEEFSFLCKNKLHSMPNYPPSNWISSPLKKNLGIKEDGVTKLVHIGALSTKGLYLAEVLLKFGNNPSFTLNFYSHSFNEEVTKLLSSFYNCKINGSVEYQDIPRLKGIYDVGLVLYNGSSLNFTYNAPNKIFEYLALDLDVWCSNKLITAKDYERLDCYPKMIMVDYEKLEEFNVEETLDKKGLKYVQSPYVCEPVYDKLINEIDEDFNT